MPGHWEHRFDGVEPLTVDSPDPRAVYRRRVWVEVPPINGRSEFTDEDDARRWRDHLRQLENLDRRAARGDNWARREMSELRERMQAATPELAAQTATQRRDWWEEAPQRHDQRLSDWYAEVATNLRQVERTRTMRNDAAFTYNDRPFTAAVAFRYSYGTSASTGARAVPISADDMVDAMGKIMMSFPLKAALSEIKEDMADATYHPADETVDPYTTNKAGTFTRTYIAITVNGGGVKYWQTNGAIPPRAVARVLARYYNTPERVQALRQGSEAPRRIHPDRMKLAMFDAISTYNESNWAHAVRSYYSVLWKDGMWWYGAPEDGKSDLDFKPIDPFEEFDE